MDKRLVGVGLSAVVGGIALAGYLLLSQGSSIGACSNGKSMFAYTVYGRNMIRSTDIAVFGEGKELRVTSDGQSGDPSFNPDGSRVVFSTGRLGLWDPEYGNGENGFERRALFITSASASRPDRQLTTGPFDTEPDWSPDGSKVVFVREERFGEGDDELWVVDVETGDERLLLGRPGEQHRDNQFRSPAWSPDGRRIAFLQGPGERNESMVVWTIDGDGSNPRRLSARAKTGGDLTWSGDVSWSPEGDSLAFDGLAERSHGIHVLQLAENRTRLVAEGSWPAWSPDGSRIAFFDETSDGPEEQWRLTTIPRRGGDMTPVEGLSHVAFYAYEELDWTCK